LAFATKLLRIDWWDFVFRSRRVRQRGLRVMLGRGFVWLKIAIQLLAAVGAFLRIVWDI